jgi:hypothetical protein
MTLTPWEVRNNFSNAIINQLEKYPLPLINMPLWLKRSFINRILGIFHPSTTQESQNNQYAVS